MFFRRHITHSGLFDELKLYSLWRGRCIGRDVLEKYEDVVGRTRRERLQVCGARARRNGLSL
jgi:hypothetical protein